MMSGGVGSRLFEYRERALFTKMSAPASWMLGGTEAEDAALVLGQPIDPAARGVVEGHLLAVAEEEVLPEVFAEGFRRSSAGAR